MWPSNLHCSTSAHGGNKYKGSSMISLTIWAALTNFKLFSGHFTSNPREQKSYSMTWMLLKLPTRGRREESIEVHSILCFYLDLANRSIGLVPVRVYFSSSVCVLFGTIWLHSGVFKFEFNSGLCCFRGQVNSVWSISDRVDLDWVCFKVSGFSRLGSIQFCFWERVNSVWSISTNHFTVWVGYDLRDVSWKPNSNWGAVDIGSLLIVMNYDLWVIINLNPFFASELISRSMKQNQVVNSY